MSTFYVLNDPSYSGLENIKRGVIKREERKESDGNNKYSYGLAVEGCGLRDVMATLGVNGTRCTSNNVMEVKEVNQRSSIIDLLLS